MRIIADHAENVSLYVSFLLLGNKKMDSRLWPEDGELQFLADRLDDIEQEIRQREKVALFVDNSSLFGAVQEMQETLSGRRIDYIKLKDYLADGRTMAASRFYYSEPVVRDDADPMLLRAAKKRRSFYYVLERAGYTTIRLPQHPGFTANINIEIVYDMCAASRDAAFDTLILVAGEDEYSRIVNRLQNEKGIAVEVAFFDQKCSNKLKEAATRFVDLSEADGISELFREVRIEEENEEPEIGENGHAESHGSGAKGIVT